MKGTGQITKDKKNYLNKIRSELLKINCSSSIRHVIIKEIRQRIDLYIEDNSPVLIDFIKTFGTPEDMVTDYYAVDGIEVLKKKAKKYFILKIVFAAVMVVVAILIASFIIAIIEAGGTTDIIDPH